MTPDQNNFEKAKRLYLTLSDAERLKIQESLIKGETPQEAPDQWQPLTMGDVYQPLDPIRYVVNELFEYGSLNILYGPPGTLKSFIMQDLAACVVIGEAWLPLGNRERPSDSHHTNRRLMA